jgi:toxin FitB
MTYLLDTCLISELVAKQPNQQVLDWLDAQVPETLYLSVITIGEIAKGNNFPLHPTPVFLESLHLP